MLLPQYTPEQVVLVVHIGSSWTQLAPSPWSLGEVYSSSCPQGARQLLGGGVAAIAGPSGVPLAVQVLPRADRVVRERAVLVDRVDVDGVGPVGERIVLGAPQLHRHVPGVGSRVKPGAALVRAALPEPGARGAGVVDVEEACAHRHIATESIPSYVSCSACMSTPRSFQCTRSIEVECAQPPELGQPWKADALEGEGLDEDLWWVREVREVRQRAETPRGRWREIRSSV